MAGWWGPPKPSVRDRELQQIINQLYRPGAALGNGGTADALRAGAGHIQKGQNGSRNSTAGSYTALRLPD